MKPQCFTNTALAVHSPQIGGRGGATQTEILPLPRTQRT